MVVPSGLVIVSRRSAAEAECPAFGVDDGVVVVADRDERVDVGVAAVDPFIAVVRCALADGCAAAGHRAPPVHRPQGPALVAGGQASGAAHLEHDPVLVQQDGDDVGEQRHPPEHIDRQIDPVDTAIDP